VLVWQAQGSDLKKKAGCWWLMPVILATQERELENLGWKPAPVNSLQDPILKKTITHKKRTGGMV
jgi:hypothetical protein